MKHEDMIQRIARDNGTTPEEVETEMAAAIEAAKDNPNFQALFGGRMPSTEEFISKVANLVRQTLG